MSTHEIPIIEIGEVFSHPNPEVERLEILKVFGWQCCVGKGQFKTGDKAVWVEPDYIVPLDRPEFSFLRNDTNKDKKTERIKVRKLKGSLSQGLIIPVPDEYKDLPVGTNLIEQLGIERYEPPLPMSTGGNFVNGPSGIYAPKFDLENYQKYRSLFINGEEVIATEKLEGTSARFVFAKDSDGNWKQFASTHYNWIGEDDKNVWWKALRQYPAIGEWCQSNPEKILFAEIFGIVGGFPYSKKQNEVLVAGFAILDKQTWLDYDICQESIKPFTGLEWAPLAYRGPFNEELLLEEAEKDSRWRNTQHVAEGIVVVPVHERIVDLPCSRLSLKIKSNRYFMVKGKK